MLRYLLLSFFVLEAIRNTINILATFGKIIVTTIIKSLKGIWSKRSIDGNLVDVGAVPTGS